MTSNDSHAKHDLRFRPGVASWITRHADRTPDQPAVALSESFLTYRQLDRRIWQIARALHDLGVRIGDRVALLHDNHAEFIPATLAIMRLGAIYVPLNPRLADGEIALLVSDSEPIALVSQRSAAGRLPRILGTLQITCLFTDGSADVDLPSRQLVDWPDADTAPDAPFDTGEFGGRAAAGLFYTSGTTGLPKGAIITHDSIQSVATSLAIDIGFTQQDRLLVSLPISVSGAMLAGILPFLHLGCTIRLLESSSPELIARSIRDDRPTYMASVPTVFQTLLDHPAFDDLDLSCFTRVLSAAAAMPVSLIGRFQDRGLSVFIQGYGLTESCGFSTCLMPADALSKVGSIGKPLMYSDVRVFVDDREALPGEIGELCVSGPSIMAGYWRRPEERPIVDGWLHTGDLGYSDDEGYLFVTGRLKDMVITGGYNVYPAEVENVIYQLSAVAQAAVVGVPDEKWGERVIAIVLPKPGHQLVAGEVFEICAAQLADYKRPKEVLLVTDGLPTNPTGKVRKDVLQQRYATGALG